MKIGVGVGAVYTEADEDFGVGAVTRESRHSTRSKSPVTIHCLAFSVIKCGSMRYGKGHRILHIQYTVTYTDFKIKIYIYLKA